MNYFFMKRHSRLPALLLVICMVCTMFAGCQSGKSEEPSDPTEESLPAGLVEVKPTETQPEATEAPTEPENENMATVIDQLNVRSSPSTGAKIIGYLDPGTQVEIIKTETYMGVEWALIREGWIVLDYVEMNSGAEIKDPEVESPAATEPAPTEPVNTTKITGKVTSNGLNIRKDPNTTSTIVGNYANGTTITILETKNGWGRTDKGWVSMTYVSTNGNTTTNNNNNNASTNNNNNATTNTTTNGATYYITATQLNIRDQASTAGKQVGSYTEGDKVVITETSNGWGKTDKGWISMQYAYKNGDTGAKTAKGIVTGNGLNIRSGPGTGYASVGNYASGARVNILEQITVDGTTWGCTDKGWISLGYVYVDGTEGDGAGTGTITGDTVNIRSGPGTGYNSVGSLNSGDSVEILAQFEIDGTYWGCTSKGWVCMDYVGVG